MPLSPSLKTELRSKIDLFLGKFPEISSILSHREIFCDFNIIDMSLYSSDSLIHSIGLKFNVGLLEPYAEFIKEIYSEFGWDISYQCCIFARRGYIDFKFTQID